MRVIISECMLIGLKHEAGKPNHHVSNRKQSNSLLLYFIPALETVSAARLTYHGHLLYDIRLKARPAD